MNKVLNIPFFHGGISDSTEFGPRGAFAFAKRLNIFEDAGKISLLPKPTDDDGGVVVDAIKWIVPGTPYDTNTYFYGDTGRLYKRTTGGAWSVIRTVTDSVGQGLGVHDDYLYYVRNTTIGRYGPLSGAATFDDNWQTGLNDTSSEGFAPFLKFKEGFSVGNGNDLAWWDGAVFDQNRVVLPPGFNIRAQTSIDEFVLMGAWRGTSITDVEEGLIFWWDGTSTTFNFFLDAQDGAVNALLNSRNRLLSIIGSSGNLYLNERPLNKIHKIPNLALTEYLDIFPGAVTNWKNQSLIGVSGNTDSSSLIQGIYQWGSQSDRLPEALNYAFTPAGGSETGSSMKITALKGLGDELYIAYDNNGEYGVELIDSSSNPAADGTIETLYFNDGRPGFHKLARTVKVIHDALASNESIKIEVRREGETSWTQVGSTNTTAATTETRANVPGSIARFYRLQIRVTLATTTTTSPTVTSINLLYDDLKDAAQF